MVARNDRTSSFLLVLKSFRLVCFSAITLLSQSALAQQPKSAAAFTINTEPNAIVWIDEVRRGVTDSTGKLSLPRLRPGRHTVRVRANGFREARVPLLAGRRTLIVKLVRTTDQGELKFQEAETTREQAREDEARQHAVDLYLEALKLRPALAAAHVGLARVLMDLNQYDEALKHIASARRLRRIYPEASAVEGRIHREAAFDEEAMRSFRRAIQEARGFQPEAHVGLARLLEEKGDYPQAIAEYRKALEQLADSEPVIYQLMGAAYEKAQNYKEALAAYEKYLELAPNGSLAPAVRSILTQLKRDASGEEIIP
ncbi:MAG TPA: tetratricopeptide repeat protein [Pyrinomonadaceae bacterium]|nr:tetratricopeptide repeat protein [Pyrinomonadaceae bacterium]